MDVLIFNVSLVLFLFSFFPTHPLPFIHICVCIIFLLTRSAGLMKDRAALSKLATYDVSTAGASFLGSRDFPPALIAQCAKCDPKGIVFGTGEVIEAPATEAEQAPLRAILDRHVKGKKMLLCTGGLDKLVPWRCSESFTKFLCNAAETWYKDSGLRVDNRIYKRRAHEFSDEMVVDAVNFIVEVVNEGPVAAAAGAKVEARI